MLSGIRSSLSSGPGRRYSENSILSSCERASSRRELSDLSLGSTDKLNGGQDTSVNMPKREMMFSPICEQNEEAPDYPEVKENSVELTIHSTPNAMIDIVLEAKK